MQDLPKLPEMSSAEEAAFECTIQKEKFYLSRIYHNRTYYGLGEVTLLSPIMSENKLVLQMDSNFHAIPVTKVIIFSWSNISDSGHIVFKSDDDDKSLHILTWGESSIEKNPLKIAEAVRKGNLGLFQ